MTGGSMWPESPGRVMDCASPTTPAGALSPPPAAAPGSDSVTVTGTLVRRADEKLGTGHGASEWSVIDIVNFVRATNAPQAITAIEYDTWDHLVAQGVIPGD